MKIHLDLDSYFISAERIKNPSLRNRPAAVGGRGDPFIFSTQHQKKIDTTQKEQGAFIPSLFYNANSSFKDYFVEGDKIRGIIITSSYEARAYGIKTGMSIKEALSLCPQLIVVPPNHLYYHELSIKLKRFLEKEIPKVEQFSIDEFFGDLDGWIEPQKTDAFLQRLQQEIAKEFGLPISIGSAQSKWIAKLATSYAKPKGVKVINDVEEFITGIPIEKFPGIGRGYLKRLKRYGIHTLEETKAIRDIFYSWKKPGQTLYKRIWGIDNEPIQPQSPKKSISISRTIDPLSNRKELQRRVIILSRYLSVSLEKLQLQPKEYFFSLKYENGFRYKAHTITSRPFSYKLLKDIALDLLSLCDQDKTASIIRLTLRCSRFYEKRVADIFHLEQDRKMEKLLKKSEQIYKKYGMDMLKWGIEMV